MRVLGTALKTYKTSLAIKQCLPRKAEAALCKNAERAKVFRQAMLNVGIEVSCLLPNGRRSECTSTLQGVRTFDLAELVPLLFPPP